MSLAKTARERHTRLYVCARGCTISHSKQVAVPHERDRHGGGRRVASTVALIHTHTALRAPSVWHTHALTLKRCSCIHKSQIPATASPKSHEDSNRRRSRRVPFVPTTTHAVNECMLRFPPSVQSRVLADGCSLPRHLTSPAGACSLLSALPRAIPSQMRRMAIG